MPIFRADFDVKSSVVLPQDSPPLSLAAYDGASQIILRNGRIDDQGHVALLDISVVGECTKMEEAPYTLRATLADHLDLLCYVTHSRLQILQCHRVMDWEPHKKSRAVSILHSTEVDYPPSPDLPAECVKTANDIIAAKPSDAVRRALHYFRMGVLTRQVEDQFHQFWLVLETIGESLKTRERIPIPCPKCNGPLHCASCQTTAKTRPMATQAIRDVIHRIVRPDADKIFRAFSRTRSHLVHGRPTEDLEQEIGIPLDRLVNEIAKAAWHAIELAMPDLQGEHVFGNMGGDFTYREVVFGPTLEIEYDGDEAHPEEYKIPTVKITMQTRFGKPPDDQRNEGNG